MPESRPVGNDVLAERLSGVREDVADLGKEQQRTRDRLHKLEGLVAMLVDTQKVAREREERQYRRVEVRLQALMVIVTVVGIVAPVIVTLLATR